MTLSQRIRKQFLQTFGHEPALVARAPGRVNLIGEHTDYNDGFVLPCAIQFGTVVAASPRNDGVIRVIAADYDNEQDHFDLAAPIEPHPDAQWANYVRGVVRHLQMRAPSLGGADLVVGGDVPQGAGLSSSASLEVGIGKALQSLYELELTGTELALIGQEAENHFVGCECGVMDQLVSALGKAEHALLIDCRSLATTQVSLPAQSALMVINSNVRRGLVGSEYNLRRAQCEQGAAFLGATSLRDVALAQFESEADRMDAVVARRVRHVLSENARTLAAAEALAKGDLAAMGELMAQSHASMRDDFEITVPPIDALVEIVKEVIGKTGGVRLTGGGFGGCVVALMPVDAVERVRSAVLEKYPEQTGLQPDIYLCRACDGAALIEP